MSENNQNAPEEDPIDNTSNKEVTETQKESEVVDADFIDLPEEYREPAQILVEENPNIFNGMSRSQKLEVIKTVGFVSLKATSHSGPLPDPESLQKYNEIIPNGADRIMILAENQQNHRFDCDKKEIKAKNNQTTRGQWFAFILAVIFAVSGVYLAMNNHDTAAGIIFGTTIVGLAGTFLVGKFINKDANKE